ncbi:vascular-related unknown protein 1 [Abrus precatorius]|uniref:Uncharacterized protein n=1 Tax=Abrus precatorius TaxID=3816 RepID=A0A8B8KX18_ABRPR|nr:vascular-related unknown protein 1 [Abrus precatorius]
MDHSLNYSSRERVEATTKNLSGSDQESGWTSYLEDFSKGMEPSSCSSLDGSSLLSDAASSAAWKLSHHNHLLSCSLVKASGHSAPNLPQKLSFKRARTKHISEDDPLEDTASSPVNSPKVRDLNPTEIISRKVDDQLGGSMGGKGFTSSENYSALQRDDDDEHELKYNGKNIDCTDLKKRGLCLVPLSLLVNYLG